MPKVTTASDDPMAKMGEAMGAMLTSSMQLEVTEEGRFKLSTFGIPIEGKVKLSGSRIELQADRLMGMTMEEARKLESNKGKTSLGDFDKPLVGTVSADLSEIRLSEPGKSKEGSMLFRRQKKEAPGKPTVSPDERAWIGTYQAKLDAQEVKSKDETERKLAEIMVQGMKLELRADNTYTMSMVFEMKGTWKIQGIAIVLTPTDMMGMDLKGSKSENEPMRGVMGEDGKTLKFEGNRTNSPLQFVRSATS